VKRGPLSKQRHRFLQTMLIETAHLRCTSIPRCAPSTSECAAWDRKTAPRWKWRAGWCALSWRSTARTSHV
jgi:hypothetical protein